MIYKYNTQFYTLKVKLGVLYYLRFVSCCSVFNYSNWGLF